VKAITREKPGELDSLAEAVPFLPLPADMEKLTSPPAEFITPGEPPAQEHSPNQYLVA
jgi:hypothetical protein